MNLPSGLILSLLLLPSSSLAQTPSVESSQEVALPTGTPLPVRILDHLPMRAGQPVRAELIYPVYNAGTLILPAHTIVTGSVTELRSNKSRRIRAALGGDLTPFHIPVVSFNNIILADGTTVPFSSNTATDGAPIFRAVAPPPSKGGFLKRQWNAGLSIARDDAAIFLAPGKADRFTQFIYSELPYHPQRIEKDTA